MYTNEQYSSFFQSYTHQTYKEILNKKHVNSKQKVLSNTMFCIPLFRTMDIHRRTRAMIRHQNCFPNQLTMVAGILLETFLYLYID